MCIHYIQHCSLWGGGGYITMPHDKMEGGGIIVTK